MHKVHEEEIYAIFRSTALFAQSGDLKTTELSDTKANTDKN